MKSSSRIVKQISFLLILFSFVHNAFAQLGECGGVNFKPKIHYSPLPTPPPDKDPYIEATNRAGIERYLARTINMEDMVKSNIKTSENSTVNGSTNTENPCKGISTNKYCCER